jgi:putative copper export protein
VFRLFVARPPVAGRGTPERVLLVAAVAGAAACLATLPLRAVVVGRGGLRAAVDPDALSLVATSRFGDAACLRLVALVLFGLALARPPRGWERRLRIIRPETTVLAFGSISSRTIERAVCVAAGAVALASFSLTGHPQASEPRGLLLAAQAAHVLAASVWFGGGIVLALEIRRQRRWGSPRCTAETVARFSAVAGAALVLVAATGTVLARSQLASVAALWSTAYGRALLAKLALVGVVVALGTYNHQLLVPAVVRDDEAAGWRTLGRTAAAEGVVMAAGILVATAAMTSGGW